MKMYDELAPWWPVISAPQEYAEEGSEYIRLLRAAAPGPIREVLELGSGGGHNASHLKRAFTMTLVEPSPGMLAVSRALNPECTHVQGDMRTVRLGRAFDAVFVHDAVGYMTSEADLLAALQTVAAHLKPGGVALVTPDDTLENLKPGCKLHEGQEPAGTLPRPRSVAYMEWDLPPEPGSTRFEVHYSFLLRDRDGSVRAVHDVHHCGVFPRATWLRLFDECGLQARVDQRILEGEPSEVFVAVRQG